MTEQEQPSEAVEQSPEEAAKAAAEADAALAKEGTGYMINEPEVAAAAFGTTESLAYAAFRLKGRTRLSEDEMKAALDELNNREV